MRPLFALAIFCLAFLQAPGAHAREEIRSFDAQIVVQKNGSLDVIETITVNAEGREIRRGIYRQIPLRSLDDWGLWSRSGFKIRDIEHNGQNAPYHTEWQGRFLRIYIGDADTFIPSGEHTYKIAYTISNEVRYFEGFDEVNWNVTGNFWDFPIIDASATVTLPDGAVAEQIAAYTGPFGAQGTDYRSTGEGRGTQTFQTTRPLNAREGLTIAIGFTKGIVTPSSARANITNLFANLGALLFVIGWAFVFLYFLIMWWRIGRDPPGETVIPLFHPPENLSPAATSYVHFKSFRQVARGTDLAFIAALLSMGVKKWLVIEEDEDEKVTFLKGTGGKAPLASGEQALYSGMFTGRDQLPLDKRYGKTLLTARSAFHSAISREYGGKFFRHNIGWFVIGAITAIVATIGGIILQNPPEEGLGAVLPTFLFSAGGWVLLILGWRRLRDPIHSLIGRGLGLILIAAGILFLLVSLATATLITDLPVYRAAGIIILTGVGLTVSMLFLLAAPTLNGAKVLSRIEGFKLYLETAETNRLNMRDAPQMSEELYERFLPYAAGLGVEEPWSKAYSAHLARNTPDADRQYNPGWYHGRRDWTSGSLAEATSASVAAVSAAMAASMPQPKSSSGSSGGGFSGGGGGGGGGGGW